MTQLAERIHGAPLVSLCALTGALVIPTRSARVEPVATPAATIEIAAVSPQSCPVFIRDRFDPSFVVTCVRGQFIRYDGDDGDSMLNLGPTSSLMQGYFVRAAYQTSEAWERIGMVAEDGSRDLAPFVDRPTRHDSAAVCYFTTDLDGDGGDEIVGVTQLGDGVTTAIEVMALYADGVVTVPGPAIRAERIPSRWGEATLLAVHGSYLATLDQTNDRATVCESARPARLH
jgi:hypothetical protein